jgi:hypothetical protein
VTGDFLMVRGGADGVAGDGLVPGQRQRRAGRDAMRPRPGTGLLRVVAATLAERHQERLADQSIGCSSAQPSGNVAVDRRRVPVEHQAKPFREPAGLRDQPAVIWQASRTVG